MTTFQAKNKYSFRLLLITLLGVLCFNTSVIAQIGINETGNDPDASAMLDVVSTDKGMLVPRMTEIQRNAIIAPATGLLIYQMDNPPGFYFYTGSEWQLVGDATKAYVDSKAPKSYTVGEFAQGGIVFWVDETGQHGLVCTKVNQSSGIRWYAGTDGNTQAKGDGPYSGEMNTAIIITAHVSIGDDEATYAARLCAELQITESKTYGDWYLPSKEELNLMYQNKATINETAGANSGSNFGSGVFWSSTEIDWNKASVQNFDDGSQYNDNSKNFNNHVR